MYIYWFMEVFVFVQLLNSEESSMTTMLNFSTSELLNPATDESKLISLSQQGDAEALASLYAC